VRDSNRTVLSATDVSTPTPACRSPYAWEPPVQAGGPPSSAVQRYDTERTDYRPAPAGRILGPTPPGLSLAPVQQTAGFVSALMDIGNGHQPGFVVSPDLEPRWRTRARPLVRPMTAAAPSGLEASLTDPDRAAVCRCSAGSSPGSRRRSTAGDHWLSSL
jgi:hypothetical protein